MLYTLNSHGDVRQLLLNKTGGKNAKNRYFPVSLMLLVTCGSTRKQHSRTYLKGFTSFEVSINNLRLFRVNEPKRLKLSPEAGKCAPELQTLHSLTIFNSGKVFLPPVTASLTLTLTESRNCHLFP